MLKKKRMLFMLFEKKNLYDNILISKRNSACLILISILKINRFNNENFFKNKKIHKLFKNLT